MNIEGRDYEIADPQLRKYLHRIARSFHCIEAAAWAGHSDDSGAQHTKPGSKRPPGNPAAVRTIGKLERQTSDIERAYERLEFTLSQGRAPVGNPFEGTVNRRGPRLPKGASDD